MLDSTQRTTAAELLWAAERDPAPGYWHLLDTMVLAEAAPIQAAGYCCLRIEAGIGYVLAYTLPSVSCTAADVLAATDYIVPSLELIDSRIQDRRTGLADTVTDNASPAGVILGDVRRTPAGHHVPRRVRWPRHRDHIVRMTA